MAVLNLGKITDQSCVNIRTETVHRLRFLFYSVYGIWNMCEYLHYESVYFKELHNDQEIDLQYAERGQL